MLYDTHDRSMVLGQMG